MPYPRNPFGLHTVDELFDIFEVADIAKREPSTTRYILRRSGIRPVARLGRRVLYRGADIWHLKVQPHPPSGTHPVTARNPHRRDHPMGEHKTADDLERGASGGLISPDAKLENPGVTEQDVAQAEAERGPLVGIGGSARTQHDRETTGESVAASSASSNKDNS